MLNKTNTFEIRLPPFDRVGSFGFLLFDLLTEGEAEERANVFDIPLLAERLDAATNWVTMNLPDRPLPLGYFGSSTGAAAALTAAAKRQDVSAIVSRGGRPDLTPEAALGAVTAATLLIVGGDDPGVLAMNRAACRKLQCECRLQVIPDATHLFAEPGALDAVTALARD